MKLSFPMKLRLPALFILLLLSEKAILAQAPLERRVSVRLDNTRLSDALSTLARQGDFNFSYASNLFDANRNIDLVVVSKPVREVLDQLFRGTLRYKNRGNYVILLKAEPVEKPRFLYVSGIVTDRLTGERLARVSVYERRSLSAAVTNENGFYQLRLPASLARSDVRVIRQQYEPGLVTLRAATDQTRDVALTPRPVTERLQPLTVRPPDQARLPTFENSPLLKTFVPVSQQVFSENVRDTLRRTFQISFLPMLGTNYRLSGSVINNVSINVLAGYSGGVEGFEIGGLVNLVRGSVRGVQVGGLGNLVRGNVRGVQIGGFFNQNFGTNHGPQIAGFINSNWASAEGVHIAGFANFTRKNLHAVQVAGFVNAVGGEMQGAQVAGFLNANAGSNEGFQLAGFANVNRRDNRGAQISGFVNGTGSNNTGLQLAGFANFTRRDQRGWQISGFANYARTVTGGHQIAPFNFADSSATTPIGFLSFVRKNGYRRLEVSADEVLPANLTFRTGVRRFYNIFTAGINPFVGAVPVWGVGYGLGTGGYLDRRQRWMLNAELVGIYLSEGTFDLSNSGLFKLNVLAERRLGPRLYLSFGPTLNALTVDTQDQNNLSRLIPYSLLNDSFFGRADSKFWVGGHVGIRFR